MGLFDLFGGSSLKWECTRCGKVHKSNPEKCKNCGATVLQQDHS